MEEDRKDKLNLIAGILAIIGSILLVIGEPLLFYQLGMIFRNFIISICQVIFLFIFQFMVIKFIFSSIKQKELIKETPGTNYKKSLWISLTLNICFNLFIGLVGAYIPIFWSDIIPLSTSIFALIYYCGFLVTLVGIILYQNYSIIKKREKKRSKINKKKMKMALITWGIIMIIIVIWAIVYFINQLPH